MFQQQLYDSDCRLWLTIKKESAETPTNNTNAILFTLDLRLTWFSRCKWANYVEHKNSIRRMNLRIATSTTLQRVGLVQTFLKNWVGIYICACFPSTEISVESSTIFGNVDSMRQLGQLPWWLKRISHFENTFQSFRNSVFSYRAKTNAYRSFNAVGPFDHRKNSAYPSQNQKHAQICVYSSR